VFGRSALRLVGIGAAAALACVLGPEVPADATSWTIGLAAGSAGQAQAATLPAPATMTASCIAGNQNKVNITWTVVAHATSYTISDSTTSAGGAYSTLASGVGGTSWNSPGLAANNYWFEVTAQDNNWVGIASAASVQRVIGTTPNTCA